MACDAITGITIGCDPNMGGVTKIYISDFADLALTDIVDTGSDGDIDTILLNAGASPAVFVEIEVKPNTCEFKEVLVNNQETGAQYTQQTVAIKLPRKEAAKRNQLATLGKGCCKVRIILKDANGIYWLAGHTNGLYLSKNESTVGVKAEDGSGYVLEFTAVGEPDAAKEVVEAAVLANI